MREASVDTTVKKISAAHSPSDEQGQRYLASGKSLALRLWDAEQPTRRQRPRRRDYETVGYVISGRAELYVENQKVILEPGDSWVVPRGAVHHYNVLETFTAVEATSPPACFHGRDLPMD